MSLVFLFFLFWSDFHRYLSLPRHFSHWGIKSREMVVTSSSLCLPIALWQEIGLYWTGCWCDFFPSPPQVSSLCPHFDLPRKKWPLVGSLFFVALRKRDTSHLGYNLKIQFLLVAYFRTIQVSLCFSDFHQRLSCGPHYPGKGFLFFLFLFFNFDVLGVFCEGLPNESAFTQPSCLEVLT